MSVRPFLLLACWGGLFPSKEKKEPASCPVWVVSLRTVVPARLLPSASNFAASLWMQKPCGLLDPASSTSDLSPLVLWDRHWVVGCLEELGVLGPPPAAGPRNRSSWSLLSSSQISPPLHLLSGACAVLRYGCACSGAPSCLPHSCSGGVVRSSGARPEVTGLEKFLVVLTWVLLALNVWRLGVLLGIPLWRDGPVARRPG